MNCCFGCLLTNEGKKIKQEMLEWLNTCFNVSCIDQNPPGELFEYPAIKYTIDTAINLNKPILYIHTKGAANKIAYIPDRPKPQKTFVDFMPSNAKLEDWQIVIRKMWKEQFTKNLNTYIKNLNLNKPMVVCPFSGKTKTTWLNAFIINPLAAKELQKTFHVDTNRFYYENMFTNTNIEVKGICLNNIDTIESRYEMYKFIWNYYN